MSDSLQSNIPFSAFGSELNALHFLIKSLIEGTINVAVPVVVKEIVRPANGAGAGYLSAMPLIKGVSAKGESIAVDTIPTLRWFRLQHGTAAIICDPKVGDIGLAVFAQYDVSNLDGGIEPKQPASFRKYDLADGFYIGGFWGKTPTTFVRIEDTGDITITAPKTVTVNTKAATVNTETCELNATSANTVTSPTSTFNGNVIINGSLNCAGGSGGSGAKITGKLEVTQDVTAGNISVQNHTHTCPSDGKQTSSAN